MAEDANMLEKNFLWRIPSLRTFGLFVKNALRLRVATKVQPVLQVVAGSEQGTYGATGNDPQFSVFLARPVSWTKIAIKVVAPGAAPFAKARLYIDRGRGLNEGDAYDLGVVGSERSVYAYFRSDSKEVRLDPIDEEGEFRIEKFEIRRVTVIEAQLATWLRSRVEPKSGSGREETPGLVETLKRLEPYEAWLEVNEWNERRNRVLIERLAKIANPPLLSVVMPVYNPPPKFLDAAIRSVVNQVYQRWELCIADDASTDPEVRSTLERWAGAEPRIKLTFRKENANVSRAANTAAGLAAGDYLAFLDHDDELSPDALAELVIHVDENPGTDIMYSDADKIDAEGRRCHPAFKPDWSPDLLLSHMYTPHLLVIKRSLFDQTGGFRTGFEGSQDYDLLLRATDSPARVGHIPKALYHERMPADSAPLDGSASGARRLAARKALEQTLDRRKINAEVAQPGWAKEGGRAIFSLVFPDTGPKVSILIPTKNNTPMLRKCLDSLKKTTYCNYEVVVIDNNSDDSESERCIKSIEYRVIRMEDPDGKFNFARLNNEAARRVDGEYVLFLNDDTEIISSRWLGQMVGYLGIQGVGAVGAKLVFPDGRIQHAGVVHGYFDGSVGHAFKLLPARDIGYLGFAATARNYSAVTAACMLTPRNLFLRMGGFDENAFGVAFNDVDYCYRLAAKGFRTVYCPAAELIHHEGASRQPVDNPYEVAAFRLKYGEFRDPYYNPNLTLAHERFEVDSRTLPVSGMKAVRALMFTPGLELKGSLINQLEMTVGLKRRGIIEPVVCSTGEGPLRDEYQRAGIEVDIFQPLEALSAAENFPEVVEFAAYIKARGVEMVYANELPGWVAIEAASVCGLPSVLNLRESGLVERDRESFGEFAKRASSWFTHPYRVVFTSNASLRARQQYGTHHNFINIYDGLDRDRFLEKLKSKPRSQARERLGVEDRELVIISIGTVRERNGQMDIVKALSKVTWKVSQRIKWYVVGDRGGAYSAALHEALNRLPVSVRTRMEILNESGEIFDYYSAADVFVCATRSDGFPRAILEAMAAGLPIIATRVPGIQEHLREGFNALFYRPGEYRQLAENVDRLVNDRGLRQTMADRSPVALDTIIDYETMLDHYSRVFQEAWLSGRPRPAECLL